MDKTYILAPNRGVLKVEGPDRYQFLQGLITQDIYLLSSTQALYSAHLNSQGRYLCDFFMFEHQQAIYLEGEAEGLTALFKRFMLYKLRSRITLNLETEAWDVILLFAKDASAVLTDQQGFPHNSFIYKDPRLDALGFRGLIPKTLDLNFFEQKGFVKKNYAHYDGLRLSLGIPQGTKDMIPEKSIPLECGLDELKAISWNKGCYIGQELTARSKYVGVVRKRLIPVSIEGKNTLEFQTPVLWGKEKIGEIRSNNGRFALALLKLEALEKALEESATLQARSNFLTPHFPDWLKANFNERLNL